MPQHLHYPLSDGCRADQRASRRPGKLTHDTRTGSRKQDAAGLTVLPTDPVASVPLWMATASSSFDTGPLAEDIEADVVVIGGGYTGLSAAYHLAEAGKSVVLLEAKHIASGASGRNAAGWLPGWPGRNPHDVEKALGPERGRRLNQMIVDAANDFPSFVTKHQLDPEFRMSGVALCAPSISLGKQLRETADQWRQLGVAIDDVSADAVADITGTSAFVSAAVYRNAGTLNPVNYSRGMARLAAGAGARIFERSKVNAVAEKNRCWRVDTEHGSVQAEYVIAATGAYSDRTFAKLNASQYKIPAMVFTSKPAPAIADTLMPGNLPIMSNHPLKLFWLMRDSHDRLVGSMLYPSNIQQSFSELAGRFEIHLRRYYPDMPAPEWDRAWSGYLDVIPGRTVQILELSPGVLAPIGFSGSGSLAAFAVGKELAKAMVSKDFENCRVPIRPPSRLLGAQLIPWLTRKVITPLFAS
ncbi:MAG: FAD-binding oxidoreductase [Pseudomonadota bacterium]